MIAVGRYDVVQDGEAEVAFLVEDRHQGRGIAQLLLEHLAQAGRERGVEKFVAEVLPDNQKMIRTFRDAGYRVAQRVRRRRDGAGVPDRPDRHLGRRDGLPRAPGRGGVDRAVLPPALGGRGRRQPPAGHDRPGAGPQPRHGQLHRPGLRREPVLRRGVRHAGVRVGQRHPRRRRRRGGRRPRRGGAGRRARLRRQGRPRPGRDLVRLRRDRRGGPAAAAPAGRARPLLRAAADRAELPSASSTPTRRPRSTRRCRR